MPNSLFPVGKGEQQQRTERNCSLKSNYGIHFWPTMTLETLSKYGIEGYICNGDFHSGAEKDLKHGGIFS
jgi:hypothetical protein